MVPKTITFQHTAKKDISLCIETSFGFEVVIISEKQALKLAQELRNSIPAIPLNFSQEKSGFPGITASAWRAGFNGA